MRNWLLHDRREAGKHFGSARRFSNNALDPPAPGPRPPCPHQPTDSKRAAPACALAHPPPPNTNAQPPPWLPSAACRQAESSAALQGCVPAKSIFRPQCPSLVALCAYIPCHYPSTNPSTPPPPPAACHTTAAQFALHRPQRLSTAGSPTSVARLSSRITVCPTRDPESLSHHVVETGTHRPPAHPLATQCSRARARQEIVTWVTALEKYDNNEFEAALEEFERISDTSKILFNMGVIHATLGEHDKAVSRSTSARPAGPRC